MTYARIRSWHVVTGFTRVPNRVTTRCGKVAIGPESPSLPLGERSCETCLRLIRHDEELK